MKMLVACFCVLLLMGGAAHAQIEQVANESVVTKPKISFSYWAMFTGPEIGKPLDSSVDGNGDTLDTGSNYFQMIQARYDLTKDTKVGVQLRTSSDFRDDQFQFLSPRLMAKINRVWETPYFSMGLQPMLEIPTTSIARQRTQLGGFLLAQNFDIKIPSKRWTLFFMTMTNTHLYKNAQGKRTLELAAMPMVTYQINKKLQAMGWAWFDAAHFDGVEENTYLNGWNDDYLRVGLNYSVLDNLQIYPCLQFFTDNLMWSNTTVGLEIAAQF